jgi:hypothetical protein
MALKFIYILFYVNLNRKLNLAKTMKATWKNIFSGYMFFHRNMKKYIGQKKEVR